MSMENLLELEDITLIPSPFNTGGRSCINYLTKDFITDSISESLPLFASPMDSITNEKNWDVWAKNKINPVIPRTIPLETRLNLCQHIFSALSLSEAESIFLNQDRRSMRQQFRICLDAGNGHDSYIFNIASRLKQLYGKQIILMGGNIENPETYMNYSNSGFDFVRIGMTSGSIVLSDKFGYRYPMASLIMDTSRVRESLKTKGIRPINIIADGGIRSFADIIKSIALGADYVMIGKEFSKILEAAGTVYNRKKTTEGIDSVEEILRSTDLSEKELRDLDLTRLYSGNSTIDSKSIWVPVNRRLDSWLDDFKEHIRYSFMLSNAQNWQEFRRNVKFGKL